MAQYIWQETLLEALLETETTRLQRKIEIADELIRGRISELAQSADDWQNRAIFDEHLALQDALKTLRYLKQL